NPPSRHSSRSAVVTASGSRISPFSTTPGARATCAALTNTASSRDPETSVARTAVAPTSRPTRVFATSDLALHSDRTLEQIALHVGLSDPVVLADPDGGELARLDHPVHRHVGHPHRLGDLADR